MGQFRYLMVRMVPVAFVFGGGVELFMIKTGFYDVALRLESQRIVAEEVAVQERRARAEARRRARRAVEDGTGA